MKAKKISPPSVNPKDFTLNAKACNLPNGPVTKWITNPCFWLFIIALALVPLQTNAQDRTGLNQLTGHQAHVYYSDGAFEKATRIAGQMDQAMLFYDEILNFRPSVILMILSPGDWSTYTSFPVYGMPHYSSNKTLIVASEDNDFWKSFIPPMEQLPADLAELIGTAHTGADGHITMEPFFDLLAIHELGHAYHIQDGLEMQRKWLAELFVNIFLHTYIAEKEPEALPQLTTFPLMVLATTSKASLKYNSLRDLETHYNEIGQFHPVNYGWYQCRWHFSAGEIYDTAGTTAVKNLWTLLKNHRDPLDDTELPAVLSEKVHQSVADVQLKWDEK